MFRPGGRHFRGLRQGRREVGGEVERAADELLELVLETVGRGRGEKGQMREWRPTKLRWIGVIRVRAVLSRGPKGFSRRLWELTARYSAKPGNVGN